MRYRNVKTSKILITIILSVFVIASITTYSLTYSEYTTTTTLSEVENASGIFDNTVVVDDSTSDYNYYMSLNYTENSSNTLPTGVNQNIYTKNNLVNVEITYDGSSIDDNSLVGYVSLSERQNIYKYYKMYPVVDGYVDIPLIENPFTDRPTNMGFNGWVTDYSGVILRYDDKFYERYARVPVNSIGDVKITFHASWVSASVGNITSSSNQWSSAFGSLNKKGMVQLGGSIPVYESVVGLYTKEHISGGSWWNRVYFPENSFDDSGKNIEGQQCRDWNGCDYYAKVLADGYNDGVTYYKLVNKRMQSYTPKITGYDELPGLEPGKVLASFYRKVKINRYEDISGYYNDDGVYQESGTCSSSSGCFYY